MNLGVIDWMIVSGFFGVLLLVAGYTRRYTRSVADFLSANRCGGRYLLMTAQGMSGLGAVSIVANFEKFYHSGFGGLWWSIMLMPVLLLLSISGWVIYRYRATRALTMGQFFEMRYSRRFRIFAGVQAWVAGMFNYGIFPIVSARFLVYFMGLPTTVELIGMPISTVALVMAVMLVAAVTLALSGGFITVMVTDFIQGLFVLMTFLVISLFLLMHFGWDGIVGTLSQAPPGQSMLDPFDQADVKGFDFWFFAITAFKIAYNTCGLQPSQNYNTSARSPHEAKMSKLLSDWRNQVMYLATALMPIAAYVLLHSTIDPAPAEATRATLAAIQDPQIAESMTVPVAMSNVLPPGVVGMFVVVILAAAVTTDDTYLHFWGSIFVQDILQPLRGGKPLGPKAHIRLLRYSIVGVAIFAFCFGLLVPVKDFIYMYVALTGAIYAGGAGACIVGGLYTRVGTTAAAWATMITSTSLAVIGMLLTLTWEHIPALTSLSPTMPLNGIQVFLACALSSIGVYIVTTALTYRQPFNLDKALHRGAYALTQDKVETYPHWWRRGLSRLGMSSEMTRRDRLVFYLVFTWIMGFFAVFLIGTFTAMTFHFSTEVWARFWAFKIYLTVAASLVTIVWFTIGGSANLWQLFRDLAHAQRDELDDGRVIDDACLVDGDDDPRRREAAAAASPS